MIALQSAAQAAIEQMLLSLAAGTAVALCAGAALRVAPQHSSRTRFALWFAVLMSIVVVPLIAFARRGETSATSGSHAWLTIPESWAFYIFGAWAVMAGAGLARVIAGLMQVRRVRKSCEELPSDALPASVRETLANFPLRRAVKVCVSDDVRVPTAIGFFRPVVVMPRWLFHELPAAEMNQIVLHELAHLARWDDWTNLAQKIVRATLFFHPAVWWIDQRLSLEREMACDDAVIAATSDRHSYAQCLAMLAEKALGRRTAALAQAAVHRMQQVTARVMRILDPPAGNARGRWAWMMTAVSTVAVAGAIAIGGTSWIAFSAAPTTASMPSSQKLASEAVVIPAAMRLTKPAPVLAIEQVKAKPAHHPKRTPMMASLTRQQVDTPALQSAPSQQPQLSPSMTSQVTPAKASADQIDASSVMVLTVFSDAQGSVQGWRLTVYVPATTKAPSLTPRKTT